MITFYCLVYLNLDKKNSLNYFRTSYQKSKKPMHIDIQRIPLPSERKDAQPAVAILLSWFYTLLFLFPYEKNPKGGRKRR